MINSSWVIFTLFYKTKCTKNLGSNVECYQYIYIFFIRNTYIWLNNVFCCIYFVQPKVLNNLIVCSALRGMIINTSTVSLAWWRNIEVILIWFSLCLSIIYYSKYYILCCTLSCIIANRNQVIYFALIYVIISKNQYHLLWHLQYMK